MPYNYTPTPTYVVPVQLASDGDNATSATLMAPIEQALDNVASVLLNGPRSIRHVPTLSALAELTNVAHNEVALVVSNTTGGSGYPGTNLGLFRFILGDSAPFDDDFRQNADDASGVWVWVDLERIDVANGFPLLGSLRELNVGTNLATDYISLGLNGKIELRDSTAWLRLRSGSKQTLEENAFLNVDDGSAINLLAPGTPGNPGGVVSVQSGGQALAEDGGIQVASGGALHVRSGGIARAWSGSTTKLQGTTYLESGSTTTLQAGAVLTLQNRIRYSTSHIASPTGTYTVTVADNDEISYGNGSATVNLGAPTAAGQRVRFTRTTMAATGIITLNANGDIYLIQTSGAGTNHVRWIELTSHLIGILLQWVPSAYSMT